MPSNSLERTGDAAAEAREDGDRGAGEFCGVAIPGRSARSR